MYRDERRKISFQCCTSLGERREDWKNLHENELNGLTTLLSPVSLHLASVAASSHLLLVQMCSVG